MTREEALAHVLYAACGADLDGHESYLKMARAVFAHLGEGREQLPKELDELAALIRRLQLSPVTSGDVENLADGAARLLHENVALRAQAAAHGDSIRQVQVRMVKLEHYVEGVAGLDCYQYDKHLNRKPCGTCISCQARTILAETDGR